MKLIFALPLLVAFINIVLAEKEYSWSQFDNRIPSEVNFTNFKSRTEFPEDFFPRTFEIWSNKQFVIKPRFKTGIKINFLYEIKN